MINEDAGLKSISSLKRLKLSTENKRA